MHEEISQEKRKNPHVVFKNVSRSLAVEKGGGGQLKASPLISQLFLCTAKTLYRKFETNIPRNETMRLHSKFLHSCICERFIYSQVRPAYFAAAK